MLLKRGRGSFLALLCICVGLVISGCSSNPKREDIATGKVGLAKDDSVVVEVPQAASKGIAPTTVSNQTDQAVVDTGKGIEGTKGFSAINTGESWDRKVIYKGNLTMEVPDYTAAQTEINNLVALASGYILQFSENQSTVEKSGNYVIKVPANGFSSFIRDLEKIKTVSDIRHNIQGQDVAEEYVDLSSRLKAKQVVEARLLAFMEKAVKTDELLSFSNELGNVQETIEQIKGRMRFLDQNVSMSTVEIRLYEQGVAKINPVIGDSTLEKIKHALASSLHALRVIAQGLIVFVAALLPVLIVMAIIGTPLIITLKKRARKQAVNASPPANYTQKIDTSENLSKEPS